MHSSTASRRSCRQLQGLFCFPKRADMVHIIIPLLVAGVMIYRLVKVDSKFTLYISLKAWSIGRSTVPELFPYQVVRNASYRILIK